jgi:hypothetical protein
VFKGRTLYPTEPTALPDKFLTFQQATPESVLFFSSLFSTDEGLERRILQSHNSYPPGETSH